MKFSFKKHPAHPAAESYVPRERFMHQVQRSAFLDWAVILAASFVIVLVLVGVGVSVYLGTGTELSQPPSAQAGTVRVPFSTQAMQSILDEFDSRAARHDEIVRGYTAPKDPSLP